MIEKVVTMIPGDTEILVAGVEHHPDVLAGYAPRAGGPPLRVAVELGFAPITRGRYAGLRGIEVRLGGRRVGELTALMSRRYASFVEEVLRRGGRPAAEAQVRSGPRGPELRVLLPVVSATVPQPARIPRQRIRSPFRIGC